MKADFFIGMVKRDEAFAGEVKVEEEEEGEKGEI